MLNEITEHGGELDVPTDWLDFYIYALAYKQGEEYNIPERKLMRLRGEASAQLKELLRDQYEESECQSVEPAYD